MKVVQSAGLDRPKLNALRKLMAICQKKDGRKIRIYWNIIGKERYIPGDYCVISDRNLVAYLGAFIFNDGEAEITAVVNPKYRHQGVFKELLKRAATMVKPFGTNTLVLCCPYNFPPAQACLKKYNATHRHTEYDMRWKNETVLDFSENPDFHTRLATVDDLEDMVAVDAVCFNASPEKVKIHFTNNFRESNREAWLLYHGDEFVGKIHFRYDDDAAFIHNVCIKPEFQGKGYGSYFLKRALNYLTKGGHRCIRLDVEAVNEGALSLYLRLGFIATQIYEFWEIPIVNALK